MPQTNRSSRIEARIAPEALATVKRAALLQGRSVSDFVVAAAEAEAHRTIRENQLIALSLADQRRFVDALLNPAPINDAMVRARAAHEALIEK